MTIEEGIAFVELGRAWASAYSELCFARNECRDYEHRGQQLARIERAEAEYARLRGEFGPRYAAYKRLPEWNEISFHPIDFTFLEFDVMQTWAEEEFAALDAPTMQKLKEYGIALYSGSPGALELQERIFAAGPRPGARSAERGSLLAEFYGCLNTRLLTGAYDAFRKSVA